MKLTRQQLGIALIIGGFWLCCFGAGALLRLWPGW